MEIYREEVYGASKNSEVIAEGRLMVDAPGSSDLVSAAS